MTKLIPLVKFHAAPSPEADQQIDLVAAGKLGAGVDVVRGGIGVDIVVDGNSHTVGGEDLQGLVFVSGLFQSGVGDQQDAFSAQFADVLPQFADRSLLETPAGCGGHSRTREYLAGIADGKTRFWTSGSVLLTAGANPAGG